MRVHVQVFGRVQGVFFRDLTRTRAIADGITGWVINRSDGSVEAVFEGDSGAVKRLVEFCHEGPPAASVERVEVTEETEEGIGDFRVR